MSRRALQTRAMRMRPRACDCCGQETLREMFLRSFQSRTRSAVFQWRTRTVLCLECGFAFASPVPVDEDLLAYYGDSYAPNPAQQLDYSPSKRLRLLNRHIAPSEQTETFIEVGSNACDDEVHEQLRQRFRQVLSVEPNRSCNCTHRNLLELPQGSADALAAYFVLEHVPAPTEFLRMCSRALRQDGLCIIEVPDIGAYPRNAVSLLLHEHLNHFSPRTLARCARAVGLELVDVSFDECSRNYGFAAVFRNRGTGCGFTGQDQVEPILAEAQMREGLLVLESFQRDVANARARIDGHHARGESTVAWGANDVMLHLLDGYELPASAIIVDSNPDKSGFLGDWSVFQPEETAEGISKASLFVICTRRHAPSITKSLEQMLGRALADEVLILDLPQSAG